MDVFAEYYDYMVGADYDKITDFIITVIEKYKPDSNLLCDLGCGTGTVALKLAERGFDMIGIDSDYDMLIKAQENISKSGRKDILLLNQDITEFELYGTVDAIYSTLDTLNYITDKRSISRLFKLVRNYLNYDGLFIFDINTEHKFKNVLADNDFIYDTEDLFCCWSAEFDKETDKCYHLLTYFEKNPDGFYNKAENYQVQRFYSEEYIENMFSKYDFELLSKTEDYGFSKPKNEAERITYVLKIKK